MITTITTTGITIATAINPLSIDGKGYKKRFINIRLYDYKVHRCGID
jgi:hypothetical protein